MEEKNSIQDRHGIHAIFTNFMLWRKQHKVPFKWEERYAYVVLALLSIFIGAAAVLVSLHEIQVNNQKFCQVLGTAVPAPKPENPAKDPSRERAYEGYVKVAKLSHDLGCS
jgi:hypothetical protein